MTSQLKIRCLLKTTAKKFWTRQEGRGKKKSCFEKGGGRGHVCDRKSEFVTEGERVLISKDFYDGECERLLRLNEVTLKVELSDED